jgi:Uma2 family endonuclease
MTTAVTFSPPVVTLRDLLERLGGVSPDRVRYEPFPGTATEQDVIRIQQSENRLYELVEGILVEKGMGYRESILAGAILAALRAFVRPRKLGLVSGEAGMMRLFAGLVRIPDVAFVSRERLPGGKVPPEPIPDLSPDLAVEVLSESNTRAEMSRKRGEYFEAGVRLVWIVDPKTETVAVYTGPDQHHVLTRRDQLEGGAVLPGFTLVLDELFAELED